MKRLLMLLAAALPMASDARAGDPVSAAPSAPELLAGEALVVDIREPAEWRETGVLPTAVLFTYRDAAGFLARIEPQLKPGQPIALLCRSGRRSAAAAAAIAARTDHPVIDVAGGLGRLVREGYQPAPCPAC
ncbi:rhodanese-like domain-containing protein [Cereibacter sphaeroides]|uniref:Rhodanese-like domain-containing protein n=1 Tax=Cereibacter sphaeroides TaxID=1063 RepID=A0AAX1UJH7_CERSP|nr:rhodanese-like domain-containing protein [Cereibacter sphaeroides]RHZ93924.1 rhodanese-like domain-containing protein [Cereibacter sphaeroides]